jgi:NADH-quinone oxidoreductase subunit G
MSETLDKPAIDTVSIEIDGVALEAPKGSMIIEAADKAGIRIPRFCYHNKLSIAANCRMCLVDLEKSPKPIPACATPVMDGMKVYTQSKRALSSQQNVMEFLLINHPLDCPICDQGGECELQDLSMGFGRSVSRFTERKRVVKDENLGALVATDMTRCIHCTRCVRFLEEIAGTSELGGMGRGENTAISTFIGRSVDSELSGNIIDLCPVGALTNKPFRFRARAWELRSYQAVANHDAVGSNMHLHVRAGQILRAVPDDNEAVNENWLCDRDRWGIEGLYADDRAAEPMACSDEQWQSIGWDQAMEQAAGILKSVAGDEIGFLLSPRAGNEELFLAQRIARGLGCGNLDHRLRQRDFADQDTMGAGPVFQMPIADMGSADAVLLVGSNIRHDQPILGHKVRQAWLAGAAISAINPIDYEFHFDLAQRRVVRPSAMVDALAAVAKAAGVKAKGELGKRIKAANVDEAAKAMAQALSSGQQSVVVLGDYAVQSPQASWLRALCRALCEATGAALNELPIGANGVGAWRAGAVPHRGPGGGETTVSGRHVRQMLAQPRKVMVLLDVEPSLDTADGSLWDEVLGQAEHVIYLGPWASDEIRQLADLIIPLAVQPESAGSLSNVDGITQVSHGAGTEFADSREGWKVLRVLGNELELDGFDYVRIDQVRDEIEVQVAAAKPAEQSLQLAPMDAGQGLELVAEVPIYAVDGLVRRAVPLQDTKHAETGVVSINPADAEELQGAERALVISGEKNLLLDYRIDERVAPGSARLPLGVATTAAMVHLDQVEVMQG